MFKTPSKPISHTPRKPIVLGSPQSIKRPVPHLVFLITTPSKQTIPAIIRMLLLMHLHINPQFTWGFEILKNGFGHRLATSRHCLSLSSHSIQLLLDALEKETPSENTQQHDVTLSSILAMIGQLTVQAPWNDAPAVELQSPLKKQGTSWKGSVKLRHFLFIVGELPHESKSMSSFLGLGDSTMGLGSCLDAFVMESMNVTLWNDLMNARIATYYIDISESQLNHEVSIHHVQKL